jgi:hypothetical protein
VGANGNVPGDNDDVTFDRDVVAVKRKPKMEAAYAIKSLTINHIAAGNPYNLTLTGTLTVKGPTASAIADGTITGGGEIVFSPPEAATAPTFTWSGGTFETMVTVDARTKLRITVSDTTPRFKALKSKLQINSLDATWDGKAAVEGATAFWLDGSTAELAVGSGAKLAIDGSNSSADAFLQMSVDSKFTNLGTVSVKMATGKKLDLSTPGWTLNYGRFDLIQGEILSRKYGNAGTTDLADQTKFSMGYIDPATGLPDATITASLVLDPRTGVSPTLTSKFINAGKLYLHPNATVSLPGGEGIGCERRRL